MIDSTLIIEVSIVFTAVCYCTCFSAAVKVNFTEENYTVNETEGSVNITMRVTGSYFVLMNATVSCKEGSADSENYMK